MCCSGHSNDGEWQAFTIMVFLGFEKKKAYCEDKVQEQWLLKVPSLHWRLAHILKLFFFLKRWHQNVHTSFSVEIQSLLHILSRKSIFDCGHMTITFLYICSLLTISGVKALWMFDLKWCQMPANVLTYWYLFIWCSVCFDYNLVVGYSLQHMFCRFEKTKL